MNPTLERNKSRYRTLLIVTASLTLLQLVLVLVWEQELALRLFFIGLLLVCNGIIIVYTHFTLDNKQVQQPISLRMFSIRAKQEAAPLLDDPDGWRYLRAGINNLLEVLSFMALVVWMLTTKDGSELWLILLGGFDIAVEIALNAWYKKKLTPEV